jgi:hypothetical protein
LGPALIPNDPCTTLSAIVTRPTVTNSVCTVRPKHVLLETGIQDTWYTGGGATLQVPQALVRVGSELAGLEFDFQLPSYQHSTVGGTSASGVTDGALGLKYIVGASPKFNFGVQTSFTIPVGTSGFSAGGTIQNYAVNAALSLGPVFELESTQNVSIENNGRQSWTSYQPTLVVNATLPSTTLSLFGEAALFTNAVGPVTPTRTQIMLGASEDPTPRLQLDLEYGFSPTLGTGKYGYLGAGLSYYH